MILHNRQPGIENYCPICFYEVNSKITISSDVLTVNCVVCDSYSITSEAISEIDNEKSHHGDLIYLRRKMQFITKNWRRKHRLTWFSSAYDKETENTISIRVVPDYPIPSDYLDWRKHTIFTIERLRRHASESKYYLRILHEPTEAPMFWYEDHADLRWMLNQLQHEHLIGVNFGALPQEASQIRLNASYWMELDRLTLENKGSSSDTVFVATWFDHQMDTVFEKGIQPAIEAVGYKANWVKLNENADKVDDYILSEIRNARFLVADFTGHRNAVYFEAGFAFGLGIPVVWTVRKDGLTDASFDTRQFNHIVWETPEELAAKLARRITARAL